jgi:hypothetical protein
MPNQDVFHSIAELLRVGGAKPLLFPERVAPSTIYDLNYRLAIIALTFDLHATTDLSGFRRMRTLLLKLLQFLAVRPWLIPMLVEWERTQAEPQLSILTSQKERRGFLGDLMHDRVVEFLVARQILDRGRSHLMLGMHGALLTGLTSVLKADGLFLNERRTLEELKDVKITNKMLEGW